MLETSKSRGNFAPAVSSTPNFKSSAKRGLDILIASALLLLLAPLMALIAAMIFARSGRGVIYSHDRIGRNGATFGCLKFRTMVRDADEQLARLLASDPAARREWDRSFKLRHDPRIIRGIGHVLRSSSLDELPQLWNVLVGQMSLVGPRPIVREELERYGLARKLYLSVRPGLTGPWQIGARSEGTYDARVREDIAYIRNWTLRKDIAIIFKTMMIVLSGRAPGAY